MTQAELFENYMRAVWEDTILDKEGKTVYNEQHDANLIAGVFMAKLVGGDEEWKEWLFADGSTAWIMVSGGGTTNALP